MKSPYQQYQDARNASWLCLIDHNVQALPVSMSRLFREMGVPIGRYCDNANQLHRSGLGCLMVNDGFTLRDSAGGLYVYYNERCTAQRIRFTLAHELGHIVMGHLSDGGGGVQYSARNIEPLEVRDPAERAANVFASRLLAPACVLWRLEAHTPEEISQLCQISITAARFRAERMEVLYRREVEWIGSRGCSCFLQSPLERRVLDQFELYIRQMSK